MIRHVMEDQVDLAWACPGAPTETEVRTVQGHLIQIDQGVIAF